MAAYPQQFAQGAPDIVDRLQNLRQHDIIEGVGRIIVEIGFHIALHDGEPEADRPRNTFPAEFDAAPVDLFEMDQVVE